MLVNELQKALKEQGVRADLIGVDRVGELAPGAFGDVVLARLARLEPAAIALARAVAILGDGAQLPDAARLAHLERADAARAAAALLHADIFDDTNRLSFTHPVFQAVVYEDISQVLRGEGHAHAARLLYERGAATEEVAAHLLRSPPDRDKWACDQLRSAGADAVARGASGAAVVLLERALAESIPTERADVLHELARVEGALKYPAGVAHATAAFEMMQAGPARAQVGLLLARLHRLQGRSREAQLVVAAARDGLGPADRELSLLLDAVAIGGTIALDRTPPAQLAHQFEELLRLDGATAGERTALAAVAYVLAKEVAPAAEVVELLERAIRVEGAASSMVRLVTFHSPSSRH